MGNIGHGDDDITDGGGGPVSREASTPPAPAATTTPSDAPPAGDRAPSSRESDVSPGIEKKAIPPASEEDEEKAPFRHDGDVMAAGKGEAFHDDDDDWETKEKVHRRAAMDAERAVPMLAYAAAVTAGGRSAAERAVPMPAYAAAATVGGRSAAPRPAAAGVPAATPSSAPMIASRNESDDDDDHSDAASSSSDSSDDDPLEFATTLRPLRPARSHPWSSAHASPAPTPTPTPGAYSIPGPGSMNGDVDAASAGVQAHGDEHRGGHDDNTVLSAALGDAYLVDDEDRVLDPSLVVAVRDDDDRHDDHGGDALGEDDDDDASQEGAETKGALTKRQRWVLVGLAVAVVAAIAATLGTLAATGRIGGAGEAAAEEDGAVVGPAAYVHPERGCPPLKTYCSADNETTADRDDVVRSDQPPSFDAQDLAASSAVADDGQCWEQLTCDLNYPGGKNLTNFRLSFSRDGSVLVASYLDDKYGTRNGKARAYSIISSSASASASAASTLSSAGATKGIDDEGNSVPARVVPLGQTFQGGTADFLSAVVSGDGRRLATVAERPKDDPQGLITVYEYDATSNDWVILGEPIRGDSVNGGIKLSLDLNGDGSVVAFGARSAGAAGVARAYNYVQEDQQADKDEDSRTNGITGTWVKMGSDIQGQTLKPEDKEFVRSVSLSSDGKTMAVGAWNNTDDEAGSHHAGLVRVYRFVDEGLQQGDWKQLGRDIGDGRKTEDQFCVVVSLSADGTTVAASARGSDGPEHDAGAGASSSAPPVGSDAAAGEATATSALEDAGSVRAFKYDAVLDEWQKLGEAIHGDRAGDGVRSVSLSDDGTRLAYAGGQSWRRGYARVVEFVDSRDDNDDDGAVVGAGLETLTSAYSTAVAGGDSSQPGAIAGEWRQVGGTVDMWSNEGTEKFMALSVSLAWPSIGDDIGANDAAATTAIVAVSGRDAFDEGLCRPTCPPTGVVRLFATSSITD